MKTVIDNMIIEFTKNESLAKKKKQERIKQIPLIERTIRELYASSDSVKKDLHELFDVKCKKCDSRNIVMQTDDSCENGGGGCDSCGYGGEGSWKFWLGLKCLDCGNAKVIFRDG